MILLEIEVERIWNSVPQMRSRGEINILRVSIYKKTE